MKQFLRDKGCWNHFQKRCQKSDWNPGYKEEAFTPEGYKFWGYKGL